MLVCFKDRLVWDKRQQSLCHGCLRARFSLGVQEKWGGCANRKPILSFPSPPLDIEATPSTKLRGGRYPRFASVLLGDLLKQSCPYFVPRRSGHTAASGQVDARVAIGLVIGLTPTRRGCPIDRASIPLSSPLEAPSPNPFAVTVP